MPVLLYEVSPYTISHYGSVSRYSNRNFRGVGGVSPKKNAENCKNTKKLDINDTGKNAVFIIGLGVPVRGISLYCKPLQQYRPLPGCKTQQGRENRSEKKYQKFESSGKLGIDTKWGNWYAA